jgi:hypothetical protein
MRKILMLCVTLCMITRSADAEDLSAGRAKLAEIAAFIRHAAETCGSALGTEGQLWPMEALSLLAVAKPPISEEAIQAKEHEVMEYRARLGEAKWCKLYAIEMKQADLVFGLATNRK